MSQADKVFLNDPTNRILCVLDRVETAESLRDDIVQQLKESEDLTDVSAEDIRILHGRDKSGQVDLSAKWFADTDVQLEPYARELRQGNVVLSVPVENQDAREALHQLLKQSDARQITHFGEWVTESLR